MRRQVRAISRALELAGIEGAKGPDVSDNIQLTYLMGDLSRLMPPLPLVIGACLTGNAGIAAVFSGTDLRPPPDSSIEIICLLNGSANDGVWGLEQQLDANIATPAMTWTDPAAYVSRTIRRRGTRIAAVLGFDVPGNTYAPDSSLPIVVSPGNIFCFTNLVANTVATIRVLWREVAEPTRTL